MIVIKPFINFISDILNRIHTTKGLHVVLIVLVLTWFSLDVFFDRFKYNLDVPIQNWIDTAVYFNNLLSPVLLFATVLLLYWTWQDTKRGLDLQRSDALYTSIIATLERSSNELKKELQNCKIKKLDNEEVKSSIEFLGRHFLSERIKKHENNSLEISLKSRVQYIDIIRTSTTQINGFGSVLNQLYLMLGNEEHKNAFKVNLYSLFSIDFLIGFLIIQVRIQRLVKELDKYDLENQDKVIKLLVETISISYKDKGLGEELFDDKFIKKYLNYSV
ncbi:MULTISPECIES: hypothetical protein [Pseudoalteromonas]|uniref:hypothetical protein n=1 Tax=Pseudoalteromonas TaxID=53246 RepID=UPI00057A1EDA|nr:MULTISPECIES: hypothetical protein [Pseudoalteromonas]ATG58232.1 hypothetical protein CPA52_08235 [Pseudoalteromonas marina]